MFDITKEKHSPRDDEGFFTYSGIMTVNLTSYKESQYVVLHGAGARGFSLDGIKLDGMKAPGWQKVPNRVSTVLNPFCLACQNFCTG